MKKHYLLLGVLAGLFVCCGKVSATAAVPAAAGQARAVSKYSITPLHRAALTGNMQAIRDILRRDPSSHKAVDEYFNTPLHYAVYTGQVDAVRALLEAEADPNAENKAASKPLHVNFGTGELRLPYGDPQTDEAGRLRSRVTRDARREIAKLLIRRGGKVVVWDRNEKTPLAYAVKTGDEETVLKLIKFGADPANCGAEDDGRDGLTALLYTAAGAGNAGGVKALLESGANPNGKTGYGYTALQAAVAADSADCVRILLREGAQPVGGGRHDTTIKAKETSAREIQDMLADAVRRYEASRGGSQAKVASGG